jgi:hypothetical protein
VSDTLPPAGYAADVPRPPIGVSIDVPDHWTVLDLNPETWDAWVGAFLDQRLAGRPNAAKERGSVRKALVDLLRGLHADKVFMAAILAAEVGGDLVSASATLAWRQLDLDGDGWDLEGLRQVYLRAPASPGEDLKARRVEVVDLAAGGALKVATRETTKVPGTGKVQPVSVTQYFIPVLDTDWLAVITATTGNPALTGGVEEVADGTAGSLKLTRRASDHHGPLVPS